MDWVKNTETASEPAQSATMPRRISSDAAMPALRPEQRLTRSAPPAPPLRRKAAARISDAVDRERDHGLGFLFLPVAMGLGAGLYFMAARDPPLPALATGFAGCLLAMVITWRNNSGAVRTLGFAVAMVAGALAAAYEAGQGPVLLDSDVTTTITGVVQTREFDAEGRVRYLIRLSETEQPKIGRPPETIRLVARMAHPPAPVGGWITGRARLSAPSGPVLPGGYDFAFRAFVDGIGAHGFFYNAPRSLEPVAAESGLRDRISESLRRLRETISARIRSVLPGDPGGIAAALSVSDRRGISASTVEALRATGLAHILAISGLHMALAAGTLYVGLRLVLAGFPALTEALPVKKFAAVGALITATAYLLISGGSVPTQRAWLMLSVMLVAVLFDRPALTMRNVALAAIVIILISPSAVAGPGFQMSFAATAALIAAYAEISRRKSMAGPAAPGAGLHQALPGWLAFAAKAFIGLAITSLVAGVATGLFSAHHFHRVAGGGLIANLIAMPLVTLVVMPMGLAALLLMPFGLDVMPLQIMGLGLEGVIAAANYVHGLGGDVLVGQIPVHATAMAGFGFVILVFLRTWLRLGGLALIALGGALALPPLAPPNPDLLISEDGRLVGLLGASQLATNAARPSRFVFRQWQTAFRGLAHTPPITEKAAVTDGQDPGLLLDPLIAAARDEPSRFHCASRGVCAAHHAGMILVAIDRADLIGAACDRADLAVVAIPVHMKACRSGARLITSRMLRQTGSMSLRAVPNAVGDAIPAVNAGTRPKRALITDSAADGAQAAILKAGSLGLSSRTDDEPKPQTAGEEASPNMWASRIPENHAATPSHRKNSRPVAKPELHLRGAVTGVVRPWTIQRYYDWRSRRYDLPP